MKKMFQSLPIGIKGIAAIVCSLISASVVMAYTAGYSIADFVTPKEESEGSYGGSNSRHSYANELGYGKLIDLGMLRGTYGGAYYSNRSGNVTGYTYPVSDSSHYAFIFSDGDVKKFGAPAGTYGDAGGFSRAAFFNDDNRSDFNIPESPTPGWSTSTNVDKSSSNVGSGELIIIIFPLLEPRSGSDSGSGIGIVSGIGPAPAPTPIPAALPLFGSGLALLWILRRASKS